MVARSLKRAIFRVVRHESGYSLIEVVVAILLLSIAIIPMVSMFDAGLEAASTSGNYDKARALANSNLEVIKADPDKASDRKCPVLEEESLNDCNVTTRDASVASTVNSAKFGSGGDLSLKKVRVIVKWDDGKEYVAAGIVAGESGSE
jgi:prepilin-type N-terminal cleavage/methylation domain-containing protein